MRLACSHSISGSRPTRGSGKVSFGCCGGFDIGRSRTLSGGTPTRSGSRCLLGTSGERVCTRSDWAAPTALPHSPQNFCDDGLSALHDGHLTIALAGVRGGWAGALHQLERVGQRLAELLGVGEAMLRLLGEREETDLGQLVGNEPLRRHDPRIGRCLGDVHEHHLRRRLGLEGELAGEQLVEDDADSVKVAASVERVAAALLGAHVLGRAADDARAGDAGTDGLAAHLGEPEVHHLDEVAAGPHRLEDDVLGLEVAVDDLEVVRFGERREHLAQHADDATEGERPFLVLDSREVTPAEELHDEVQLTVGRLAEVDDRDGVRMVQPAGGARLGDEAGGGVLLADQVRVDDLDRDGAREIRLFGPINAAHSADADQLHDQVAAGEPLPDERVFRVRRDLGHGETARGAELVRLVDGASALGATAHRRLEGTTRLPMRGNA